MGKGDLIKIGLTAVMSFLAAYIILPKGKEIPVVDPNLKPEIQIKTLYDSTAIEELNALRKKYTYLLLHPVSKTDTVPLIIPDTCKPLVDYYEDLVSDLVDSLIKYKPRPTYVFRDSSYKYLKLIGTISAKNSVVNYFWSQKPIFKQDNLSLGLLFPVFDYPIGTIGVRVRDKWWLDFGYQVNNKMVLGGRITLGL